MRAMSRDHAVPRSKRSTIEGGGEPVPLSGTEDTQHSIGETLAAPLEATTAADSDRGKTFGRYIIVERLGAGGMGEVYTAYDPELERKVALKVLHPRVRGSADAAPRLLREAQTLAKLSHPNVVPVYDVGTVGDDVYVAMEHIKGRDLREWCREARTMEEMLTACVDAGRGLEAAHQAGLVHRDVKPENILVGDGGRVRVIDFGIARVAPELNENPSSSEDLIAEMGHTGIDSVGSLTNTGAIVGTPAYMAPEQFHAEAADDRSDQFSFCVSVYEALVGVRPFEGKNFAELAMNVTTGEHQTKVSTTALPKRVVAALERGLSLQPKERFGHMSELLAALEPKRKQRPWLIPALVIGALVTGGLVFSVLSSKETAAKCEVDGELADTWNDSVRSTISSSFASAKLSYAADTLPRVEAAVDKYSTAWLLSRKQACEATANGTQTEDARDLRIACLDRRERELGAVVTLLSSGEAKTVENAVQAVAQLSRIADCDNLEKLRGETVLPVAVEHKLSKVKALHSASRYDDAETALEAAKEADTDGLGKGWLLFWSSRVARSRGQYDRAAEDAFASIRFAAAHGDRGLEAEGWLFVSRVKSVAHDHKEADRWLKHAAVAIENAGSDPAHLARLALTRGRVERGLYRYKEALESLRESIVLSERAHGVLSRQALVARSLSASTLTRLGRDAEAEKQLVETLTKTEELVGKNHISVAARLASLAIIQARAKKYDLARVTYNRALKIQRELLDADHPSISVTINNLGSTAEREGKFEQARILYKQALDMRQRRKDYGLSGVARSFTSLAANELWAGKPQDAISFAKQAIELTSAGDAQEAQARTQARLCTAFVRVGRIDDGLKECRDAVALLERVGQDVRNRADALTALAVAELAAGNPEEAVRLARKAISIRGTTIAKDYAIAETEFVLARALSRTKAGDVAEALALIKKAEERLRETHKGFQLHLPAVIKLREQLESHKTNR